MRYPPVPMGRSIVNDHELERVTYYYRGPSGVVQFVYMPSTPLSPAHSTTYSQDMALDLGYHAICKPDRFATRMTPCDTLGLDHCYYDGSSLTAGPILEALRDHGEPAAWVLIELYYHAIFDPDTDRGDK